MVKNYKKFITTGCSFTCGVLPFEPDHNTNLDRWRQSSFVWPHYVYSEIADPETKFINLAVSGNGNEAAFHYLIYYLELYPDIDPSNILVGFNITGLERIDQFCNVNDPKQKILTDARDVIDLLKINTTERDHAKLDKFNSKFNLIEQNQIRIIQAITYLEYHHIDYFFMFMTNKDYNLAASYFKKFIDSKKENWVQFDREIGMMEFCVKKNLTVSDTDLHPNREGHELIAQYVNNHLKSRNETQ